MTNQQFTDYIKAKLDVYKQLPLKDQTANAREIGMLQDALRIMTHGTGPARRRFRRDYERNLARQGVTLKP